MDWSSCYNLLYLFKACFHLMILLALSSPASALLLAKGTGALLEPQEAELWCESCIVSCTMGYSFASCDKGAFYTGVVNGRLGFEVWMHASSIENFSNHSTLAVEQQLTTAYIDAGPEFTNAVNLTVKILFEATCVGQNFHCQSRITCDLIVTGDGIVLPSTLQSAPGGLLFSLTVALQTSSPTGKVMLALAKGLCLNLIGGSAKHRSSAVVTIRFDRRPVTVNLWTAIPDTLVQINNVSRTIQATNKIAELILYLDFTHPVSNTSEELSKVLESTYGIVKVLHRKNHGNRQFGFKLASVQSPAVVTVSLDTSQVISRAGTIVKQPSPVTFLYDMVRPQVKLTPASSIKTQDRNVAVVIEFTKPVFSFNSQSVTVINGQITSFDELSKSLYTVQLLADAGRVIAISIKENKTSDITGNFNAYSNVVYVRHYVTPAVSIGLYSFTSVSLIATSFAAAILAISSASLAAAGTLTTAAMRVIISDPSRNLLGMAGHLQVFALSQRMAVNLPIEYHETTKGLQWLIPHAQLPWERQGTPTHREFFAVHRSYTMPGKVLYPPIFFFLDPLVPVRLPRSKTGRRLSANASMYGPALSPSEYKYFFQVQILDSSSALANLRLSPYNGWHDFMSNMFWLVATGGALVFLHFLVLGVMKWRFGSLFRGALLPPRFELFLSICAIPGFCQALAFIIRGGTTIGIIVGVILLAVPAGFLLSVILFLSVAVLAGRFVQYHEVRWLSKKDALQKIAVRFGIGKKTMGSWTCKERLPSTFLSRFGLLFEDRKGPPDIVIMDCENLKGLPQWVNSGSNGIGRMRAVNSNDDSDEAIVSKDGRILGAGQASYIVLDLARRTLLGIVFGAYNPTVFSWTQVSIVLGTTLLQLLYLLVFRPYIRRGVQAVETISMLCETVLFALGFLLLASASPDENHETLGLVMLSLLLLSLVVQLANQWYALMNQLLRLSFSQPPSLKMGIKMLFWGLLLPLIPKGSWSQFMSSLPLQLKTSLVTVVPASPEIDVQAGTTPQGDPTVSSKSEAVVLAYGPGSPCFIDPRMATIGTDSGEITTELDQGQEQPWNQLDVRQAMQGKRPVGSAKSTELKTLRELAKASFPRGRKDDTLVQMHAAKGSFEPFSSMASPSSFLVEQRSTSRAGVPLPARTNSGDSSSIDDLEISKRELATTAA